MASPVISGGQVRGIRETMITLRQYNKVLFLEAKRNMRNAVKPVIEDARNRIPDVPTGRRKNGAPAWQKWKGSKDWDVGAARKGVSSRISIKAPNKRTGQIDLLAIVERNPAAAVLDMAGKAGKYKEPKARGEAFVRAMHKGPSRFMWPAAEAKMHEIEAGVKEAVKKMERDLNEQLKVRF